MTVTQADIESSRERLMLHQAMLDRRRRTPIEWYRPSYPGMKTDDGRVIKHGGQLALHRAPHIVRVAAWGNGSGKTTCMGAENYWWFTHTHPYQPTPKWPILGIWFVRLADQFELVREQLIQQVFGTVPVWKKTESSFIWPDGGRLVVAPADNDTVWSRWQGVPVDLVSFDEWPPETLLVEMLFRRRGYRQTRFVIAATNTDEGDLYPRTLIYEPWLKHHVDAGLNVSEDHEDAAYEAQLHPLFWLHARGGVEDQPGSKPGDAAYYASLPVISDEQRRTRTAGGFMRTGTACIFDAAGMEFIRRHAEQAVQARSGSLEVA